MIVFLVLAAAVTLSGPVIGGPRNRKHDEQADLLEDRGHR